MPCSRVISDKTPQYIYIFIFFNGELRKKYLPGYLTYLVLCLPAFLVFCLAGKQIQVFAGKRYKISSLERLEFISTCI